MIIIGYCGNKYKKYISNAIETTMDNIDNSKGWYNK